MPPGNVGALTRMALRFPAIVPELLMPPENVGPVIAMALKNPAGLIALELSIRMPWLDALIVPHSVIWPVIVL